MKEQTNLPKHEYRTIQATGGIAHFQDNRPVSSLVSVLQRKIGMEFQSHGSNWNVKKSGKSPGHGELIFEGEGFRMETDSTDLEYVTTAVDDDKVATLAGYVQNAANIHKDITINKKIPNDMIRGSTNRGKTFLYKGYLINNEGDQTAHPQASVGIKLDQVFDFIKNLSEPIATNDVTRMGYGGTTSKIDANAQKTALSNAMQHANFQRDDLSSVGKGFLAIVQQYVEIGKRVVDPVNAKNAMPVMSRTSLRPYWKKLPVPDQTILQSIVMTSDMFDDTSVIASQAGSPKTLLRPWFADLIKDAGGTDSLIQYHSVSALHNIKGKKKMKPNKEMKKFNMSTPTDIGRPGVDGIVTELRALGRNVYPDEWAAVATAVGNMVGLHNNKV